MKISNSIPALLFLTGMMCLFFSSCNDDESERGTLVPLRLSMTIPAAEGSVTTRAAETGKFNIALSTSSGYAHNTKTYITSDVSTSSAALTSTDPLKISRLLTSTPLTLYGTYNYSNLGNQPVFYSGNVTVAEGAVSVEPQWGNAIIVVEADNKERYQVNIKSLYSPKITNGQYTWNTTEKIPTLESSGANPTEFETTSTITQPSALADGYYASVVPGSVGKGNNIMSITEWNGTQQGDTYQVKTPSEITFEANKCYFITLNVNAEKEVTMDISIAEMTTSSIDLSTQPGIYDLQDLKDFRDAWNNNNGSAAIASGVYGKWLDAKTNTVKLYADIDLNNEEWVSIISWNNVTFDGNDHTLSNLYQTQNSNSGIFFQMDNATVKNLTIEGATINTSIMANVITFNCSDGIISNCHIKNATLKGYMASGFVYAIIKSKIEGCSISNSSITATTSTAAGITSSGNWNTDAEVTACSVSDCTIDGVTENSGIAIVVTNNLGATITACIVSDTKLVKNNKYHAIAEDGSYIINGCYFANVTVGDTEINSGNGYLPNSNELQSDVINKNLNSTLDNKSSSFPFKFVKGVVVKK